MTVSANSSMKRNVSTGDHVHAADSTNKNNNKRQGGGEGSQRQQHSRHFKQHSHGNIARSAHFNEDDSAPPVIVSSSPGTPPKKVWEKSYSKFLTLHRGGGGGARATSGGSGGGLSTMAAAAPAPAAEVSLQQQQQQQQLSPSSSASLTPKGLLSRKIISTRHAVKQQQQQQQQHGAVAAAFAAPLQQRHVAAAAAGAPSMPVPVAAFKEARDSSVRGGNFFSQVFRSASTGTTATTTTSPNNSKPHRKIKSISISDELDGTLRRGAQKSSYGSHPKLAALSTGTTAAGSSSSDVGGDVTRQRTSSTGDSLAPLRQPQHAHAYHSPGGTTTRRSANLSMGNIIQAFEGSSSSSSNIHNNNPLLIPGAPPPPLLHDSGVATAALQQLNEPERDDNSCILYGLEPPLTTHLSARTTRSSSFLAGRTFLPPANSIMGGGPRPLINGLVSVVAAPPPPPPMPMSLSCSGMVVTENDDDDDDEQTQRGTGGGGTGQHYHHHDELDERIIKKGGCSSSPTSSSFSSSPSSVAIAAAAAAIPTGSKLTSSAMKKAFTDFHNSQTTGHDGGSAFLHGVVDTSSRNIFCSDDDGGGGANIDASMHNNSSHHDSSFHKAEHFFWAAPPPTLTSVVSHGNLKESNNMATAASSLPYSVSTLCLESVPEHHHHRADGLFEVQHQHRQSRILRPFNRVDSWQPGRRYLIAPAVLAACPTAVWHALGGGSSCSLLTGTSSDNDNDSHCSHYPPHAPALSAQQAAAAITESDSSSINQSGLFQRIILGDCLVSHGVLGAKTTATTTTPQPSRIAAQWSSACLVLQQNYLLEFPQGTFGKKSTNDITTPAATVGQGAATEALAEADASALLASTTPQLAQPRGYAHLEFSQTFAQDDFCDALELQYYASPCAKKDLRVVLIRLSQKNAKERDAWKTCLNRAASLQMEDLYSIFTRSEFEKQGGPGERQQCMKNGIDALSIRHHGHQDDKDEKVVLGKGQYSAVYPARRKDANQSIVALKVLEKNAFWKLVVKGRERADTLVRETSVQATLSAKCTHLNSFLRLRGLFESSTHVALELEYVQGTMDLFQYISSKGVLSESEAAQILSDILHSLAAMSQLGLAHRDVKPANVLMCNQRSKENTSDANRTKKDTSSSFTHVKVCDFGMSTFVGVDGQVRGRCGTPGYVAPEIFSAGIHGGYGNQVDVFSAGVTLYVMLCGYEPFYGETDAELVENNRQANVDFPPEEWSGVSAQAKDLVRRMMEPDPRLRPSAKEVLKHEWFQKHSVTVNAPNQKNKNNSPHQLQLHENYNLDDSSPDASACVIS